MNGSEHSHLAEMGNDHEGTVTPTECSYTVPLNFSENHSQQKCKNHCEYTLDPSDQLSFSCPPQIMHCSKDITRCACVRARSVLRFFWPHPSYLVYNHTNFCKDPITLSGAMSVLKCLHVCTGCACTHARTDPQTF